MLKFIADVTFVDVNVLCYLREIHSLFKVPKKTHPTQAITSSLMLHYNGAICAIQATITILPINVLVKN